MCAKNFFNRTSGDNNLISYEFPLNEKVRTWLRLEDLFARMTHFASRDVSQDHHAALLTLFEILEVAGRGDLKSEVLQELDRQKRLLSNANGSSGTKLPEILLAEVTQAAADLLATVGKTGQHLRDNEWLMAVKQRATIPGGMCEFDLPSYHYWLQQDANWRRTNLQAWLAPFQAIRTGIEVLLRVLRHCGSSHQLVAQQGMFQQMQGGKVSQILRISFEADLPCIPEVSANKYVINIRFVAANFSAKAVQFKQDVPFELTFCGQTL